MQVASTEKYAGDEEDQEIGTNLKRSPLREGPNCSHTPTDYRHTDKHLKLVMAPIALNCTRQSRAPGIDRCAPEN